MKNTKLLGYLLALCITVASCSGEDGDPGPQGEKGVTGEQGAVGEQGAAGEGFEKAGYLQGTVSGKRTDGTPFSEPFKFEYGSSLVGFENNYINLSRSNKAAFSNNYFQVDHLQLSGNTLVADPDFTSLYFKFSKELNATDLFVVNARPYFKDVESFVRQISANDNNIYKFATYSNGAVVNDHIGTYAYMVLSYPHPNALYRWDYSEADGTLLGGTDPDGNLVTSGNLFDLYNQLTFKHNAEVGEHTFFDKATDISLHRVIPDVPADQFTVTNYVHDASTGVMSFDFVLKISQYRPRTGYDDGFNSSEHDLTITGSFSSGKKIYSNVVGRTASGE